MESLLSEPLDLQKICRVCLYECSRMFSIFSELYEDNTSEEESPTIYEMLVSISNIKMELNDGLPSSICTKCIYETLNSYKFQKQCNRSQEILDSYALQLETLNNSQEQEDQLCEEFTCSDSDFVNSLDITAELTPNDIEIISSVSGNFNKNEPFDECVQPEMANQELGDIQLDNAILNSELINEQQQDTSEIPLDFDDIYSNLEDDCLKTNDDIECKSVKQDDGDCDLTEPKPETDVADNMKYYRKQLENGKKVFACNLCDKEYQYSGSLKIHLKGHSQERPFVCHTCRKGFKHLQSLMYHQRSHSGAQPYVCKVCGKRYKQSGTLTAHMRVHTGVKPFQCSVCGKGFRQAPDLSYHMRTHTKEKPYMCTVCGRTMSMQSHLVQHMRTHTGERPFRCNVCNKAFPSTTRLKRHEIIHTGLKPYSCDVCDKSFNRKSTLFVHAKIHTDERPHVCPICSKGFIQHHALRAHILTHSSTMEAIQNMQTTAAAIQSI